MVDNKCSWKRSTSGRRFRRGSEFILISKINPPVAFKTKIPSKHRVYIDSKKDTIEKEFKTKSGALKFARTYMKKSC